MSGLSKRELKKVAVVRPRPGDHLAKVAGEMVRRADTYFIRVTCLFNGVQFVVSPGMSVNDAIKCWRTNMMRQYREYLTTTKAELARRQLIRRLECDIVRSQVIRLMLATEKLQVPLFKRIAFKKAVCKNSADRNRAVAVNFAVAWGVAMQQVLRKGMKIAEVAEVLSRELDCDGITGFQYAFAVSFLVRFWKHGKELLRWYNSHI